MYKNTKAFWEKKSHLSIYPLRNIPIVYKITLRADQIVHFMSFFLESISQYLSPQNILEFSLHRLGERIRSATKL